MTVEQNRDFAKLELQFLEKVQQDDASEQVRMQILIFYWIEKQMMLAVLSSINSFELTELAPVVMSDDQKSEFAYMQIPMIHAASENNTNEMAEVEIVMRLWIDDQISKAVNKAIQPYMKNAMKIVPISKN